MRLNRENLTVSEFDGVIKISNLNMKINKNKNMLRFNSN